MVLILLGLKAGTSTAGSSFQKKVFKPGYHRTYSLKPRNKEMENIIIIVKSLKESGLLLKGASETFENEAKEQKGRYLSILLGTLGTTTTDKLFEKNFSFYLN